VTAGQLGVLALAGLGAGIVNAIVGSGTLITFPVLLSIGLPPVTANVTNTFGLVPGNIASTWGYRADLAGQRPVLATLAPASVLGAATGAVLLLALPQGAFGMVVPGLIGVAVFLVLGQPWVQRCLRRQQVSEPAGRPLPRRRWSSRALSVGTYLCGVYGGYFGAAQGVVLIGLMGMLLPLHLRRINALKNVLVLLVNVVACLAYLVAAPHRIDWGVAATMAVGTTIGGWVGSRVGRRLPAPLLRGLVAGIGLTAITVMLS
jgi:uncharacterized membrane protein YfcA